MNRGEILALWEEFEAQETAAQFAAALDRLPLLHNQQTRGGTWIHGITHNQVQRRVGCIEEGAPTPGPSLSRSLKTALSQATSNHSQKLSKLNLNTPFTRSSFRSSASPVRVMQPASSTYPRSAICRQDGRFVQPDSDAMLAADPG